MSDADRKDRAAAARFWAGLDNDERFSIGDDLVLGQFDWREWLSAKPSAAFLDALDRERLLWES